MRHAFILLILACGVRAEPTQLEVYPAPDGASLNHDYTVTINGQVVPTYDAPVRLDVPYVIKWTTARTALSDPPAENVRHMSFAYFDFQGRADVEIKVNYTNAQSYVVRPLAAGIQAALTNNTLHWTLTAPKKFAIEINDDLDRCLFLVANPLEHDRPKSGDPHVLYFDPGIHDVDRLVIRTNDTTVYVAGGAVLRGRIYSDGVDNLTIRGRGIIDGSQVRITANDGNDYRRFHELCCLLAFKNCKGTRGLRIDGVTLIDPPTVACVPYECAPVRIDNVNIITRRLWGDGIDLYSCRDVTISNALIRSCDDCISPKADDRYFPGRGRTERVLLKDCILWQEDNGSCYRQSGACSTDLMRDIKLQNIDMLHTRGTRPYCGQAIDIMVCDAALMANLTFEDIRIEDVNHAQHLITVEIDKIGFGHDSERGMVDGLTFRRLTCAGLKPSVFLGNDVAHAVHNVLFDDCRFNGRQILTPSDGDVQISNNVYDVRFTKSGPSFPKVSPDELADAQLALAQRYVKVGLKANAKECLALILRDYAQTKAAEPARQLATQCCP